MKTTKEQARIYLDIIANQKDDIRMHEDAIENAIGVQVDCSAGIFKTMWFFLDRYIDLVAEQTGIDNHALSWFVFENDCGRNKMSSAWPGKEMRVIDSIDAFLDFQYEQ
jgi:hypothetical protein